MRSFIEPYNRSAFIDDKVLKTGIFQMDGFAVRIGNNENVSIHLGIADINITFRTSLPNGHIALNPFITGQGHRPVGSGDRFIGIIGANILHAAKDK